jgi:hypothetical protein
VADSIIHQDVNVAVQAQVLKPIVQHHDVCPEADRGPRGGELVRSPQHQRIR